MTYFTKEGLYDKVHRCKKYFGLSESDISFDLIKICNDTGITVCEAEFNTKGLRGIAFIGDSSIVLNSQRSGIEQNFDCAHELMHLCIHNEIKRNVFRCFDKMYPVQDKFIEWQANEGAAEFFVPYKMLLPIIADRYNGLTNSYAIKDFKKELAEIFKVTSIVIEYRLESLKYEIHQYLNGAKLDDIKILSVSQQKKQLIKVKSLNDIENNMLLRDYNYMPESKFINFDAIYI